MRSDLQVWSPRLVALMLGLLPTPTHALAHRVDVSARIVAGEVLVKACYHDGLPVREADVTVRDSADKVLAEGTTDAHGRFSVRLTPIPAEVRVVVDTGDGHRGTTTAVREDQPAAAGATAEHDHAPHHVSPPGHGDAHEMNAALVHIESELHEIAHELEHLRQQQSGASFERGLAGVGFILGLTGVAAYCLARRAKQG